jgi:hypothetical protein
VDEELKKAAYLGLNLVDFEDHFSQEYATMQEVTRTSLAFPSTSRDVLSEILRGPTKGTFYFLRKVECPLFPPMLMARYIGL